MFGIINANIKLDFLKGKVNRSLPPLMPSTVSISTILISGFCVIKLLKSSWVQFNRTLVSFL